MIRTIIWFIWFAISLIISIPFIFRVNYLIKKNRIEESKKLIHKCTSLWAKSLLKVAGVNINVSGLENIPNDKTVLFIGNHQGNFDIPLLMAYIDKPKGFISKIEAKKIPIVVKWMELIHCVFMDRSTLKGSAGAIIEGIKVLKSGHSLVIFPEGTRSHQNQMGEFKHASFKLATKPGIPIVPVTIDGSYKIMEQNNNKIKPAQVKLTIHPMITTKGLSKEELENLPDQVAATIASALPNNQ